MNIAVVLSGGTGTRLDAAIPKQYIKVNDKMIITYSLETLLNHPQTDGVLIVADIMWQEEVLAEMRGKGCRMENFIGFASPGGTRQFSILNGLRELQRRGDISIKNILIHDAARPNLSADMVSKCMEALKEHEGVMPVLPMKDTIYISEDGKAVTGLLDRSRLFAGQAPEGFRFDAYLKANEVLLPNALQEINGSTEPAVRAGLDVVMIPGDEENYKITTRKDLQRFKAAIKQVCRYNV